MELSLRGGSIRDF